MENKQMINDNPNFMDITSVVFREIGGNNYKLVEEKNSHPATNVHGMFLIDGRYFSKRYL